jgi:release factor glutamine methyltransferase
MQGCGISVSWAGGRRGREVIDVLMPKVARILSNRGLFYLVCITENDPEELLENGRALGFLAEKVKQEQRGMEELFILRFQKATESS